MKDNNGNHSSIGNIINKNRQYLVGLSREQLFNCISNHGMIYTKKYACISVLNELKENRMDIDRDTLTLTYRDILKYLSQNKTKIGKQDYHSINRFKIDLTDMTLNELEECSGIPINSFVLPYIVRYIKLDIY